MSELSRLIRNPWPWLAAYAAVGLFTFGHAAAGYERYYERSCATTKQRLEQPSNDCYFGGGMTGLFDAIVWPLYWSWELQTSTPTLARQAPER